ncbi:MAG: ferredoxin [Verrucomicrobiales bacterium]|jgi:ferredoxin
MNETANPPTSEPTIPRFPDNVAGAWYVNEDCITCGLCSELAPDNFRESEDGDHTIVFKQPSTADELEQAQEAMDSCPVESIVCEEPA